MTRVRSSTNQLFLAIYGAIALSGFVIPAASFARQDVVLTKRDQSSRTVKRRGEIVDWKGLALTLRSNGRDREIDNDEIVSIQTNWSDAYLEGVAELRSGKAQIAIVKLDAALQSEKRSWARRIVRARLIDAHQAIDQPAAAAKHFLKIVQQDPQTRFLYLAPLPWAGTPNVLDQSAQQWIAVGDPIIKLMGASWLLSGSQRNRAIVVLEGLSRDIDPRVKSLATAQLWRTRANVNPKQVDVWKRIVSEMPEPVRAGPYLVLANAQARANKTDDALISLMRVRILYPDQRSLAAAALYQAGNLLENQSKSELATTLRNELKTTYPESAWARQVSR